MNKLHVNIINKGVIERNASAGFGWSMSDGERVLCASNKVFESYDSAKTDLLALIVAIQSGKFTVHNLSDGKPLCPPAPNS